MRWQRAAGTSAERTARPGDMSEEESALTILAAPPMRGADFVNEAARSARFVRRGN